MVSFHDLADISQVDFSAQEGLEYFHLQDHIERMGLNRFSHHLNEPKLRGDTNRLISRITGKL